MKITLITDLCNIFQSVGQAFVFLDRFFSASCCTIYLGLSKLKIDQNTSRYPVSSVTLLFSKASVICPLRESEINCETFSDLAQNKLTAACWLLIWCRNTEKQQQAFSEVTFACSSLLQKLRWKFYGKGAWKEVASCILTIFLRLKPLFSPAICNHRNACSRLLHTYSVSPGAKRDSNVMGAGWGWEGWYKRREISQLDSD